MNRKAIPIGASAVIAVAVVMGLLATAGNSSHPTPTAKPAAPAGLNALAAKKKALEEQIAHIQAEAAKAAATTAASQG